MYLRDHKIRFLSLRFLDNDLEKDFFEYYFHKTIHHFRVSLLVGLFLYSIFGILDKYIIPDSVRWTWIIRYAVVVPLFIVTWLLSFSGFFKRFMQWLLSALVLIAGSGIIVMLLFADSPGTYLYYNGLILVIMYAYTFIKLRFFYASIASWIILLSYAATIVLIKPLPLPILLNNSFFLLSANLIGMFSCYQAELSLRLDFLQRNRLQELEQQKHLMEKEKILKDLHDGVGGMATTIAMLAEMAQKESSLPEVKKTLLTISDLACESITEIRSFLRILDSRDLSWQALEAEYRYRASNLLEPCGIAFSLRASIADGIEPPGSLISLSLFNIYREALTNVLKHSRATVVVVDFIARPDTLRITIHDNGIGFGAERNGGRGLKNMRARAAEIGGTLQITNKKGTQVEIMIPLTGKYLYSGMV